MTITMKDIFYAKTPDRVIYILDKLSLQTVTLDDIFDINIKDAKRKYRELFLSNELEFIKLVESGVTSDLKYLEKLDIFLLKDGTLFSNLRGSKNIPELWVDKK